MDVIIDEFEVTVSIAPQRLYKSFILDMDNFMPKANPYIKSFKILEGDGGVGTIKLVTYVQGDEIKTLKHKVDEIGEINYGYKFTVSEGEITGEDIEYFINTIKMKLGPNEESCIYSYKSEYYIKKNDPPNTQNKIIQRRERSKIVIQSVEAYLLAHPQEYV